MISAQPSLVLFWAQKCAQKNIIFGAPRLDLMIIFEQYKNNLFWSNLDLADNILYLLIRVCTQNC